jgi:RNA polymerase sigma factor (TIGR02999 family)
MDQTEDSEVTRILHDAAAGVPGSLDRLIEAVYEDLRALAAHRMARHGGPVTIRPTELVHEAYGRLFGGAERSWADRRHFINSAVAAMRSVLIDRARRRAALRRGGGVQRTAVDEVPAGFGGFSIVDLDDAISALRRVDARAADAVCYRVYAGLANSEIARLLEISERSTERELAFARVWLQRELTGGAGPRGEVMS